MIEKHFFADADTPFHVWVRERSDAHGFRWVLRHASQVIAAPEERLALRRTGRKTGAID